MEKLIRLKTFTKEIAPGLTEIQVKRGRNIEAKIYPPNEFHPDTYRIEKSGMSFDRDTREAALEFVREGLQSFMDAFTNAKAEGVSVIMVDNEKGN